MVIKRREENSDNIYLITPSDLCYVQISTSECYCSILVEL